MRFRFSLRLFLILFTVIAIGVGIWTQLVWKVKDQVRRHKAAIVKLKELHIQLQAQSPPKPPTYYESFARRWIDAEAFSPVSGVFLGFPILDSTEVDGDFGRLKSKDVEEILGILQDVYGVPEIMICVDRLSHRSAKLLAARTSLVSLYIDCKEIDPGATREFSGLKSLEGFGMMGMADDDALLVIRDLPNLEGFALNVSKLALSDAAVMNRRGELKHAVIKNAHSKTGFIQALANQKRLVHLRLLACDVDRDAAKLFAEFSMLETVEIDGAGSIDSDLWSRIAKATHLKTLDVTIETRPSAEGIQALAKCSKLEALNLEAVILTGDDLRAFTGHPSLKQIRFSGKIPDREIEAFLRATPKCAVGMYKPDSEGFGPGKMGRGLRGKFYRLVNDKLDTSTNVFLEMVRP